ncbi:hypothetical protein CCH79_00016359 [Gambusia affinis]|uniref:Disease resistance R13L4/SHOC-2-like LRR domain-containing protein n=2 Tax=Gambusia affinis TaxID=33528 RepID=A0A315W957_GAMAF|nr:hypothetical protein CCH79_00016359 [Gambusia affinis]
MTDWAKFALGDDAKSFHHPGDLLDSRMRKTKGEPFSNGELETQTQRHPILPFPSRLSPSSLGFSIQLEDCCLHTEALKRVYLKREVSPHFLSSNLKQKSNERPREEKITGRRSMITESPSSSRPVLAESLLPDSCPSTRAHQSLQTQSASNYETKQPADHAGCTSSQTAFIVLQVRNMAKKRKKPKPLTLRAVQKCVDLTTDGRRRLDLSYKGLNVVPACVQKVTDVSELNLSRNLLKKLPPFIDHFDSTAVLDLHSNYIEEIPQNIKNLTCLTVLNLCNNRLTSLPIEIGKLSNLHILNLGLNLLKVLPTSIGNLKELRYLGLSYNNFTTVPSCTVKLKKLEKLNLEGNPIKYPEVTGVKKESKVDRFHVVKESLLCRNCLESFQIEREKLDCMDGYDT